jgi:hypothetical protein
MPGVIRRALGIVVGILAVLFTALMWSGVSVRDLLQTLHF